MRAVLAPCFLLLAGCATSTGPGAATSSARAQLGEEFSLALGDSIPLDGTPYVVVFEKVLEDSRCPLDVTCVWEGNARVAIGLSPDMAVELNTSTRFPTKQDGYGLVLELRRLEPAPRTDTPTLGYTVTLIARKP